MQRKAYVTGTAALLAALLAGCTSGSGSDGSTDDANPGDTGASAAAQPGRYRTLPEPCGAVGHDTLDALLPGIRQITDPQQQDKAYQGEAALTYDTDRKVGCRWKVESADATDRLSVDLERVVSYDNTVSDDDEAEQLFQQRETGAHLPEPKSGGPESGGTESGGTESSSPESSSSGSPTSAAKKSGASASPGSSASGAAASPPASPSPSPSSSGASPSDTADLQPRTLSDLGDEAYIDDQLSASGSTAEQRTVTVVFRTSNVVVTIEYEEQPTALGTVPDSKEMQDRARNLAARLDDALGG
ncbi:DUF3558 domain-containing protein [Streptomyces sp. NPDC127190]|uniref:DUF3558 domain-containing protein n=1 Tax=unclassified Streptomyces TaxID=2593676 RepID=UPI003631BB64